MGNVLNSIFTREFLNHLDIWHIYVSPSNSTWTAFSVRDEEQREFIIEYRGYEPRVDIECRETSEIEYESDFTLNRITNDLIHLVQTAHRSYQNYLDALRREEEKKQKEKLKEQEEIEKERAINEAFKKTVASMHNLQQELKNVKEKNKEDINNLDAMRKHLKDELAKKNKNNREIIAQLFDKVDKLSETERKSRKKVEKLQNDVERKKSGIIENEIKKKFI